MIVVHALWSVIAWPIAFVMMGLALFVPLPLLLFIPFERLHRRGISQTLGLVPYLTMSQMTITYDPKFDPERPSVYTQNHVSMLDAHVACAAIPNPFCGLENAAHFKIPIYGWLMKVGNGIPVPPRGSGDRMEMIMPEFKDRADRGISILTFPEGHRTLDGKVQRFKRGAFLMARNAELPIVPLAVRGAHKILHKGTWIMRPGHIEVYVGAQIETQGLSDAEVDTLVDQTRNKIQAWVEQESGAPGCEFNSSQLTSTASKMR